MSYVTMLCYALLLCLTTFCSDALKHPARWLRPVASRKITGRTHAPARSSLFPLRYRSTPAAWSSAKRQQLRRPLQPCPPKMLARARLQRQQDSLVRKRLRGQAAAATRPLRQHITTSLGRANTAYRKHGMIPLATCGACGISTRPLSLFQCSRRWVAPARPPLVVLHRMLADFIRLRQWESILLREPQPAFVPTLPPADRCSPPPYTSPDGILLIITYFLYWATTNYLPDHLRIIASRARYYFSGVDE